MKLISELNEKPIEGDMLIFDGKNWILIRKWQLLDNLYSKIDKLEKKLQHYEELLKAIDKKLKSHHNALNQLTKGE